MNNDTFLIENDSLEVAQDICKYIENETTRSRSVANAFAAIIAKKYFSEIEVDIESGLYKNCRVLEDIEIADIYIKNNYIDVRIYFSDNELCVPKANFDKEILPLAYMFIKLDKDMSGGSVTGFILPTMIDKSTDYNGYYKVDENDLISFYDVEAMLSEGFVFDIDEDFNAQIYDYLDSNIDNKDYFYRVLLSSKEARELLYKATMANINYNLVSKAKIDSEIVIENTEEPNNELYDNNEQELAQNGNEFEDNVEDIGFDNLEEYSLEDDMDLSLEVNDSLQDDLLEEVSEDEILEVNDFNTEEELLESADITENIEITEEEPQEDFVTVSSEMEATDLLDDTEALKEDIISEDIDIIPNSDNGDNTDNSTDVFNPSEVDLADLPEDNDFDFSTNVTPSINTIEEEPNANTNDTAEENLIITNSEEAENNTDNDNIDELVFDDSVTEINNVEDSVVSNSNAEELETLFNDLENEPQSQMVQENMTENYTNNEPTEADYQEYYTQKNNKGFGIIPLLGVITLLAAAGYFGYTKYFSQQDNVPTSINTELVTPQNVKKETTNIAKKEIVDAMPIETVEKEVKLGNKNEGLAVEIPAIEKNLDASILVSNLSIQWEVPAGYATNNTAKRYFTKMGKIIQLNLKSEMLLLNKPPITNKIIVELEFNKSLNKFQVKGIVASSGENTVDELIKKTVQNALDINLSMNMSVFNNIQGNPSLVIRL